MVLAGCSTTQPPSTTWTDSQIVSGVLLRLDQDSDGALSPSELHGKSVGFESIDSDGDQSISPTELLAAIQAPDPLEFDARPSRPPVSVSRWRKSMPQSPQVRLRWERIQFLAIEVSQRSPQTPTPNEADALALATEGGKAFEQTVQRLHDALVTAQP
jgi:hypothetical protein